MLYKVNKYKNSGNKYNNKYNNGRLLANMLTLLIWFIVSVNWNPNIAPKYGMANFDTSKISSLEYIWLHIRVLLCNFYRKQSWHMYWTRSFFRTCYQAASIECLTLKVKEDSVFKTFSAKRKFEVSHFPYNLQIYNAFPTKKMC